MSNPTVFEWLASPIVCRTSPFTATPASVVHEYFLPKRSVWHYVHMAQNNNCEFLHGEQVKAKRYFYVSRPVLACRWILATGTPPPMPFAELAAAHLPEALRKPVRELLDVKMNAPEVKLISRMGCLNEYLDDAIADIKACTEALPKEPARPWDALDALFFETLNREMG